MKKIIFVFLIIFCFAFFPSSNKPIDNDCTCNDVKLYGKVEIVEHFPDFKVQVVEHFEDIKVEVVEHFPNECGKWQFVEHFPDFKVQFVEHFPDFKIKYVNHFPGIK